MQPLLFFFLLLLSFSSPFLFSLSSFFSRRIFGLILPSLLVFFPVKRLQFSFGTFSKIRQDNALTFTVTHILQLPILQLSLTYRHPQIHFSLFWSFSFFSCYKWIGEEGRIVLRILYGAQQCRVFEQVKLRCLWIWYERNAFRSFKEECCCLRKKNYEG